MDKQFRFFSFKKELIKEFSELIYTSRIFQILVLKKFSRN
jgi:hypothetical protein